MNKLIVLFLIFIVTSCDTKTKVSEEVNVSRTIDSTKITIQPKSKNVIDSLSEMIKIPVLGIFNLSEMTIDSTHNYGGGDCFGKITRYSLPQISLGIDSMNCGEYGYTFTHYLLTDKNVIQVVHRFENMTLFKPISEQFSYVLTEKIIDFNEIPATIMIRTDTVDNYLTNSISTNFTKDTLPDTQTSYEHWEIEYDSTWKMEADEL